MSAAPGDLIAVTGGTGSLGQRVVQDLLDAGYRVRLLGRAESADSRVEQLHFDLLAEAPLDHASLAGCSAVVHLAAHIPADQEDPAVAETCFRANSAGTARLLQAMERAGVTRLLHTTAANAYATGMDAPDEGAPLFPAGRATFYLASKVAQDMIAARWVNMRGFSVTTLRVSALYGAGQAAGLFSRFAAALLSGEPIRLANGGTYGADFVTIGDVSRALLTFLGDGTAGVFNIASGVRSTLLDVVQDLRHLTNASADLIVVEPQDHADPGFPRIDIGKARGCGFRPTALREGLAELVEWVEKGV